MNRVCVILLFAAPLAFAEEVTWTKQIAPLVWKNCAGCHRPGQVAPFSLLTYADVKKRAEHVDEVVSLHRMPPWKPADGYAAFLDRRGLTQEEIDLIGKWVDDGAKEGDPKDLPPTPVFSDDWMLGTPDIVLTMPEVYSIPADGPDIYRCFVMPLGLEKDTAVGAIEFRPGNRRVVHHALFFLDTMGLAETKDKADEGPGYTSFGGPGFPPTGGLGGWAPGAMPRFLPDGLGRLALKGSDLVMQIHYHPDGKPETDQSTIGIYFVKKPATNYVGSIPLTKRKFTLPAGDARTKLTAEFGAPVDLHAIGVVPHMHLIGKEMKAWAVLPDGKEVPLVWIKDWDFNWQDQYLYQEPIALPKGTKLMMEAYYDNTDKNSKNPNKPPKDVRWGEKTTDEMCICFLMIFADDPAEYKNLRKELMRKSLADLGSAFGSSSEDSGKWGKRLKELIARFDKDGDGKLNDEEKEAAMEAASAAAGSSRRLTGAARSDRTLRLEAHPAEGWALIA